MYIRTITRKNKNESVQYVQLAHNYRNPKTGHPQAKILYNFGRKDELDVEALKRLAMSITRFLSPDDAQEIRQALSAEDIVLGYKQLMDVERCFRDLKHTLDIRPVYHRLSDRIRSHVLLCWLGLLLIRMSEQELGQTWRYIKRTLHTAQIGHHQYKGNEVWMTNPLTSEQAEIFKI